MQKKKKKRSFELCELASCCCFLRACELLLLESWNGGSLGGSSLERKRASKIGQILGQIFDLIFLQEEEEEEVSRLSSKMNSVIGTEI